MPYKHIASFLKKTELACRLHYHQLSHGSNRRKRAISMTSPSAHSAMLDHSSHARLPTPIEERSPSSTTSTREYSYSPTTTHSHIHLPAIQTHQSLPPPLPIAILPKPNSLSHRLQSDQLRLDCSAPSASYIQIQQQVDPARLQSVYLAHRLEFWSKISADYGPHASPDTLEQAWYSIMSGQSNMGQRPPTPCISPEGGNNTSHESLKKDAKPTSGISVSALLGIDANPRSPNERELVRLMEEGRRSSIGA